MSPSTCLSRIVLQDLGFLFHKTLGIRDKIKGTGRKRGHSGDKIRWEEKSGTKEALKSKAERAEEMPV
jgi:hypothetical protein